MIGEIRFRDNVPAIIRLFSLCLAGFVLGRLFIFPGFLDPFTPSHLDLFRYFMISQEQWGFHAWLQPRPLMMAFLHLVGILHSPSSIWFILSLTSLIFVATLLLLLQKLTGLKLNNIPVLLYSVVVFSIPSSYEIYQLDFGGMLAGVLSIVAIYVWYHFYKTDPLTALSFSLIIYWASLETKPTFVVTMLLLSFLQLLSYKDKYTFLLFVGVFFIPIMVVLKDRFLGSTFINFEGDTGVYSVEFNLVKNISALWVYLRLAVPIEVLPGLVIAWYLFLNVYRRGQIIIVMLLPLAISSVIPMALIPNRTLGLYSWYCGMLACIPFLYIFNSNKDIQSGNNQIAIFVSKFLLPIGLIATIVALLLSTKLHEGQAEFDNFVENYNKHVLASFVNLSEQSLVYKLSASRGVLVAGLRGPFHPFKNRVYIQSQVNLPDHYVLLLRKSEAAWNEMSNDIGLGVYSNELDVDSFNYFVLYDQDGNFSNILSLEEVEALPEWLRIPTLICNLDPSWQASTVESLENIAGCLDEAGEGEAVIELVNNSSMHSVEFTAKLHYYIGHAYQSLGDISSARREYELALALGGGAFFQNALETLPDN